MKTAHTFTLTFATPEKVVYEGPAFSLTVPGLYGSFQVLAQHASLIALTHPGTIHLQTPQDTITYHLSQGVFEMSDNHAYLLVDQVKEVS